jgi:hypothetical protein
MHVGGGGLLALYSYSFAVCLVGRFLDFLYLNDMVGWKMGY